MTDPTWSWDLLDPETFYDEFGEREWERLDRDFYHRLEFDGTVQYLETHLPPDGRVLDVGGGAGRYAVWLAERGYDVTLLDLSETQVELAREKAADHDVADHVTARRGDVRSLDVGTDAFDATLCLGGPLSHVLDADERAAAAAELARVSRPNAPVFVSVMGRLAALQNIIQHAGEVPDEVDETELVPELARNGTYDRALLEAHGREPAGFDLHLFRVAELEALLENAGLAVETVAGLESVASLRREGLDDLSGEKRAAVEEAVDLLREDRAVADLSSHVLAVCYAPGPA